MMGSPLLLIGLVAVGLSLMTLVLAFSTGAGRTTGVARSLALIEHNVDAQEVGRNDLPLLDRLVFPVFAKVRGLAFRLSPSGASESMSRRLDLAGNPGSWTAERIMGAKGAGLLGLADRLEVLGGALEVHSPEGEGTRIRARVPLAA